MSKTQTNVYLNQILREYTKNLLKDMKARHEQNEQSGDHVESMDWTEFIYNASISYFHQKLLEQRANQERRIEMQSLIDLYQYLMDPLSDKLIHADILKQYQFHPQAIQILMKYFPQLNRKDKELNTHGIFIRGDATLHESDTLSDGQGARPTNSEGAPYTEGTSYTEGASHSKESSHAKEAKFQNFDHNTSSFNHNLNKTIDFSKFFAICLLLASDASISSVLLNAFDLFSSGNRKISCALLKKCLDWLEPLIEDLNDRMIYDCFMMQLENIQGIQTKESMEAILHDIEEYSMKECEKFNE